MTLLRYFSDFDYKSIGCWYALELHSDEYQQHAEKCTGAVI